MADLLGTFRRKAEELIGSINQKGGISGTIESLRRQMAVSDQRRAIGRAKDEIRRLDRQLTEMITAVGVQAVGLHKTGILHSPELDPLCQHIVELEAALAKQKADLASLEAALRISDVATASVCAQCGRPLPEGATFCPYCGASAPSAATEQFCMRCGARLRENARFCAKCGQTIGG